MADLSITAANVGVGSTAILRIVQVGETVSHSQPVYLKTSDGKYWKDDADLADENRGITLTAASADGYAVIITDGDFRPGATLVVGETYIVSATAGAICPIGDLASGDYSKILGQATSASNLYVKRRTNTVAKA